jgi:hypothetical protein
MSLQMFCKEAALGHVDTSNLSEKELKIIKDKGRALATGQIYGHMFEPMQDKQNSGPKFGG